MEQTVFEQVGQQIDDVKHKAARAASAFANVVEDGSVAVRTAARDGASAATEIIYKTRKRVQRHPIESMTLTFAAGLAAGAVLSCLMRPKQTQP
jgi:ElaB/YqjD/DUF883 family membrane-anchored ribosome-binding protein